MDTAHALTQETIFGMADGTAYSGALCLSSDGQRYFFAHAQADGNAIALPHDHWRTREAALRGLAAIASGKRKPRTKAKAKAKAKA